MRRDKRIPRTLQIAAAFEGERYGHVAGDIVRFRGDGSPLRSLRVGIDPVQDLHGYDSPWPAGGGKNLFNIDRAEGTPIPDNTPASTSPRVMDTTHYFVGATRNNYYDRTRVSDFSINGTEISLSVDGGGYGVGFPVAVVAQETYALSFTNTSNGKISIGYYDANWNYLSEKDGSSYQYTFTTPASCAYAVLVITAISISSPASLKNIQLELGSTATPYAPYSNLCPISGWTEANVWVKPIYDPTANPTATIQLGQTVYGGVWDVLSGVLRVTHAEVDLGTLTWTKIKTSGDHWRFWAMLNTMRLGGQMISSQYRQISATEQYIGTQGIANQASGSNVLVMVSDERYADAVAFKAAMSGVQLVYELATPLTYTLTPQQLDTLAGQNVMWGDCGPVDVEYVADNGVEGGKLALLLRNKPELLIAMRKGGSPQELLLAMGSRGDARPGITPLKPLEEKKDEDEEAMRK